MRESRFRLPGGKGLTLTARWEIEMLVTQAEMLLRPQGWNSIKRLYETLHSPSPARCLGCLAFNVLICP